MITCNQRPLTIHSLTRDKNLKDQELTYTNIVIHNNHYIFLIQKLSVLRDS